MTIRGISFLLIAYLLIGFPIVLVMLREEHFDSKSQYRIEIVKGTVVWPAVLAVKMFLLILELSYLWNEYKRSKN